MGEKNRPWQDTDYVDSVLSSANEPYERQYELKRRGYDINRVAERVADIYGIAKEEVFLKGRQQWEVKAGAFFAFGRSENWACP
jgi:hypothetical protein